MIFPRVSSSLSGVFAPHPALPIFLQAEGFLYPEHGQDGPGEAGDAGASSPPQGQRDIRGGGLRPQGGLFQAGQVRRLRADGPDTDTAGNRSVAHRKDRHMLNVGKIEEGFVLDHIKAGKSLEIGRASCRERV